LTSLKGKKFDFEVPFLVDLQCFMFRFAKMLTLCHPHCGAGNFNNT